nr:WG repeat-containing protein [Neobacillus sp. Marseille-Q6967]
MSKRNQHENDWIPYLLALSRAVYLFPVSVKEVGGTKWGYINERGKVVLLPIYQGAGDFQDNGLAIVQAQNRTGVINEDGYFIVKPKYDAIEPFSEGRAVVIDNQGFKVIDESGKEITSKAYSFIQNFQEGRAAVGEQDKESGRYLYGYLNRRGKEVIPLSYESASPFELGKTVVKLKEGNYALIDLNGKILERYFYPFVDQYGQGLLAFKRTLDGKWGYMDEHGTIKIQPRFSQAGVFTAGRAIVSVEKGDIEYSGVINLDGKFIIKPNYNRIENLGEERFAIGKAVDPSNPCKGYNYAVANSDGRILTGFIYDEVTSYQNGLASAFNRENTFFIDRSGKRVSHLPTVKGSGTLRFDKTVIKGEIDFRQIYFNKNGGVIWRHDPRVELTPPYVVTEHKYKPNKDYLVYFPQVTGIENGESINITLKELAGVKPVPADTQLDSSYVGDFNLPFFQKDLLVVEITGYDYPFCAAHGMPVRRYAHINVKTGRLYELKDLFKPEHNYVNRISNLIKDQIKNNEEYSYVFPDSFKEISTDQPFFITENALNIYFAPYEIAPYAAGFPTFTIPFSQITSLIAEDSHFWSSFH